MNAKSSNFVNTMRTTKCIIENITKVLPSFSTSLFSISNINVKTTEIFVTDFSGTTKPRVVKLGMTSCIVYNKIGHILLIIAFICPFFFLIKILSQISQLLVELGYSYCVHIFRVAKYSVCKKFMILISIDAFFSPSFFFISHSHVMNMEFLSKASLKLQT